VQKRRKINGRKENRKVGSRDEEKGREVESERERRRRRRSWEETEGNLVRRMGSKVLARGPRYATTTSVKLPLSYHLGSKTLEKSLGGPVMAITTYT
jgi:hypothetical protein